MLFSQINRFFRQLPAGRLAQGGTCAKFWTALMREVGHG
jgi:hypothetical protein